MKTTNRTRPTTAVRFRVAPTCDGYEVVDYDGRAVSNSFATANRPMAIAAELNSATTRGHRAVARALGAFDV